MTERFYTVTLYVLVAIAPLVSIALVSATGTAFALSFYAMALVVLSVVALVVAPARTDRHDESAPDVTRSVRR